MNKGEFSYLSLRWLSKIWAIRIVVIITPAQDPDKMGQWIDLYKMRLLPIKRHLKIIAQATPYDET